MLTSRLFASLVNPFVRAVVAFFKLDAVDEVPVSEVLVVFVLTR